MMFFSPFIRINSAVKATIAENTIKITLRALISGLTPVLIRLNISRGKVLESLPAVKLAIRKSSKLRTKAKRQPAIIPGINWGSKTWINACNGVAPKSRAASSK